MIKINLMELKSLYESNLWSMDQLAKRYHCTIRTISNKLNQISCIKRKKPPKQQKPPNLCGLPVIATKTYKDNNIIGDTNAIGFICDILHGPIKKMYFGFIQKDKKPKRLDKAFNKLLKLPGNERAKILRANKKLKEYYTIKTWRA